VNHDRAGSGASDVVEVPSVIEVVVSGMQP